ncbi:MAG: ABC transporter ATP-binding protein [Spirochaetales bacterium]|nr:ABC transporter ATP-binding protein [Spirochaetales bacterium]MBQ5365276.1 ABC transporter ATP-binding protein [Spirochaetales bacterium]
MADAVRISGLSGGYEDNRIFNDLSLSVAQGGFIAIAGPNGAGKSTLLKHLIRELRSPDGTVFLMESDINSMRQREIARLISFQSQYNPKGDEFTVKEAVALGRYTYGDVNSSDAKVMSALEMTGIAHLADKYITRISGGEFQLAMLARTICQDTQMIALDEPVNNLDPRHQIVLLRLLRKLADEGRTIICVLHDLNAILQNCDRCILLNDGKVFAYGCTDDVLTEENIRKLYRIDAEIIHHNGKRTIIFGD